jgi:MFS superfamily sulfate permease-like transporter
MYNAVLEVLGRKSGDKIILGSKIQEAEQADGSESAGAVALEGQRSLLNVGINSLKETATKCRRELRNYLFRTEVTDSEQSFFYLANEFPEDRVHDGRLWRLQVGNAPMKADAITFRGGGAVVGNIPAGLPSLTIPRFELSSITTLLPMAIIISLLGFMEAISIAKAMATKTSQRLDPNQELIGQGLANMVGSVGQSYAVSGSFSRSAVNLQAGAVSGLSSVFSSGFVVITLLFFTPLLYHLPQAVLAAIIMMAVFGLVRARGFVHAWKAQWYDGAISIVTFLTTLAFAPHLDRGIIVGVAMSIALHLFRDMRPSIALLAKHYDGTFRNRKRFALAQCRHIAVVRYQGSLIFANVIFLEEQVLERVAAMPHLKHVLIVGNGINELDASGEEKLSVMIEQLRGAGYDISFSGLNDSVLDVMRRTGLYGRIGEDHLYRNATRAIEGIWAKAHKGTDERKCPLISPVVDSDAETQKLPAS